jgi:hypothetical protein
MLAALRRAKDTPWLHCGRCVSSKRDIKNDCPGCDLTDNLHRLKRAIKTEVVRRWGLPGPYPSWPFEFGVEDAMEHYGVVVRALARSGDTVNPKWDEEFAAAAAIVLQEHAQVKAEEDYERGLRP